MRTGNKTVEKRLQKFEKRARAFVNLDDVVEGSHGIDI